MKMWLLPVVSIIPLPWLPPSSLLPNCPPAQDRLSILPRALSYEDKLCAGKEVVEAGGRCMRTWGAWKFPVPVSIGVCDLDTCLSAV